MYSNINFYFVASALDGCNFVRIYNPFKSLATENKFINIEGKMEGFCGDWRYLQNAKKGDVAIFHRINNAQKLKIMLLLQKKGVRIIYDNDDTFKKIDRLNPFHSIQDNDTAVIANDASIFASDLATASTKYLLEEFAEIRKTKPLALVPNWVDLSFYDEKKPEPFKKKIRVGIVGSAGFAEQTSIFKPIIDWLVNNKRFQVVYFGKFQTNILSKLNKSAKKTQKFFDNYGDKIEQHEMVAIKDYPKKLQSLNLDVFFIPRKENHFNKAKSAIKFLEACAVGALTVAQSFSDGLSPYDVEVRERNAPIFLAKTQADYIRIFEEIASFSKENVINLKNIVLEYAKYQEKVFDYNNLMQRFLQN